MRPRLFYVTVMKEKFQLKSFSRERSNGDSGLVWFQLVLDVQNGFRIEASWHLKKRES